ncbi:MAG: Phenylacetic acid catabolic protein, partial [Nocardioidaceae bacterium]
VWPYVGELFESDDLVSALVEAGIAVDPAQLREPTLAYVDGVVAEATLTRPEGASHHSGGRRGIHTEAMGYLLAEMQHLARSHPGATW